MNAIPPVLTPAVISAALTLSLTAGASLPAPAAGLPPSDSADEREIPADAVFPRVEKVYPRSTLSGGTTEAGDKITLASEVLFKKDSAKLDAQANAEIKETVSALKKHQAKRVNIDGFTDNVRGKVDNKKLSRDRATAINRELTKKLPQLKTTVKGHGAAHPLVPNDSEANKKKNRRVEVTVSE